MMQAMKPRALPLSALAMACTLAAVVSPQAASAQFACELCDGFAATSNAGGKGKGHTPVRIEMSSDLTFGRLALIKPHGASARLDHETGSVRVEHNFRAIGGMTFQGRARITGEPMRAVRVELPHSVRMRAGSGRDAELTDFETDLPATPVLDANGELEFTFGGRLKLAGGIGGNYRGRVQIQVRYD